MQPKRRLHSRHELHGIIGGGSGNSAGGYLEVPRAGVFQVGCFERLVARGAGEDAHEGGVGGGFCGEGGEEEAAGVVGEGVKV